MIIKPLPSLTSESTANGVIVPLLLKFASHCYGPILCKNITLVRIRRPQSNKPPAQGTCRELGFANLVLWVIQRSKDMQQSDKG